MDQAMERKEGEEKINVQSSPATPVDDKGICHLPPWLQDGEAVN